MTYMCPVCGWPDLKQSWTVGRTGGPAEKCPSCGFEFGTVDSSEVSFWRCRWEWIADGKPFRSRTRPAPPDWDAQDQLDRLIARDHPQPVGVVYTCPVCGYAALTEEPRSPSGGGSYEICPSCGFEFGFTDDALGFSDQQWRAQWVADGMPWRDERIQPPPAGWDPKRQLAAVTGVN